MNLNFEYFEKPNAMIPRSTSNLTDVNKLCSTFDGNTIITYKTKNYTCYIGMLDQINVK